MEDAYGWVLLDFIDIVCVIQSLLQPNHLRYEVLFSPGVRFIHNVFTGTGWCRRLGVRHYILRPAGSEVCYKGIPASPNDGRAEKRDRYAGCGFGFVVFQLRL
jgi:hypothetical protein